MLKKLFLTTLTFLISVSAFADIHWDYVSGSSGPIENTNADEVNVDDLTAETVSVSSLVVRNNWILSDDAAAALTVRGPNNTEGRLKFQAYKDMSFWVDDGGWKRAFQLYDNVDGSRFFGDLAVEGTTTTDILTITGGSDLAEPFHINAEMNHGPIQPGMVTAIDPENPGQLRISSKPYDRTVVGVISGAGGINPGMIMQQNDNAFANGEHPIALTGRVFVQADASNGAIQPGDLLTTSSTPGHVMRVTDHAKAIGAIIGKAMTGLDAESGLVLMVVALQ